MTVEFRFDPTKAEVAQCGGLLARHIYPGGWFPAFYLYNIFAFVGVLVLSAGAAGLAWDKFGISLPVQLAIMIGIYLGYLFWMQTLNRRRVRTYLNSSLIGGMTTTLSDRGLAFTNGRSSSLTDWRDVDRLVESKTLMVACLGHQGYPLSDRMLAQAGNPAEVKSQIRRWYAEARSG